MPSPVSLRPAWALVAALALLAAPAAPADTAAPADNAGTELRQVGAELTARFLAVDTAPIYARMSPLMRASIEGPEAFRAFARESVDALGEAGLALEERVEERGGGFAIYRFVQRFEGFDAPIAFQWVFDADRALAGFVVQPLPDPPPDPNVDRAPRTTLRLPFDGEWTVVQGGRTREENIHVDLAGQRHAYDFSVIRGGAGHAGDAARNEDYFCWGRAVLAPAAGEVAAAVDGRPDRPPGEPDLADPAGNSVVIDHGNGEWSVLAHLKNGSLAVKRGDTVQAGDRVGACGNSGMAGEPKLHYHLQDAPGWGAGAGLPAPFVNYRRNGTPVPLGMPSRGQSVQPMAE